MLSPIPELKDYSISTKNGFLPDSLPLRRLPDVYYSPWEEIIDNLQALILSKRIRWAVNRLPILSTTRLATEAEEQRAYSILGFIAHSYIWGGDKPAHRLPACIAVPFLRVSERLEIAPVATYASVALWNFRTLFQDEGPDSLENLATLQTFTGGLDEQWFYLVSVAIEARGAPVLPRMLQAITAAREGDAATVAEFLDFFAECLEELTQLLGRMYESCDPHVFYFRIRPFLAGSKNMEEAGLPHGVWYEDENGEGMWKQYSGGSNAQSTLIQAFDIILGIEHRPTRTKKFEHDESFGEGFAAKHNFIEDMRNYMPGPHRRFLERLASVANIRDYVNSNEHDRTLINAYDSCLAMLRAFRDKHIQVVSRYIVVQACEAKKRAERSVPANTTTTAFNPSDIYPNNTATTMAALQKIRNLASADATKKGLKGTGGTALIPFLKQARDETGEPALGSFARKVFRQATVAKGNTHSSITGAETETGPMVGLAGYWFNSTDMGGLCSY